MAPSSILRTLEPWTSRRAGAEFVDEGRTVMPRRGFGDFERPDDGAIRVGREYVLNDPSLVPDVRSDIGQNIPHILALLSIVIVSEPLPDEDRPDAILERQAIRQLAVHERARRQYRAELDRR